jgi:hypothetical protein
MEQKQRPKVDADELLMAVDWVSVRGFDTEAYICRTTGKIYQAGGDDTSLDEDLPKDLKKKKKFLPVPDKQEFDIGRRLLFRFIEEELPDEMETVAGFFSHAGAFGNTKDLLRRKDLLDKWHAYEEQALLEQLREWAEVNGLEVTQRPR